MDREEAIDLLDNLIGFIEDNHDSDYDMALKMAIEALEQEPKTGHWILKRLSPTRVCGEHLKEYECSECYRGIRCTESQLVNYPYCHCGAKMESEV